MKIIYLYILNFITIIFVAVSCSNLYRNTAMELHSPSNWTKTNFKYLDEFAHVIETDTIFIHPLNRNNIILSSGPPFLPIIPNFLFGTLQKDSLQIEVFLKSSLGCELNLGKVKFFYNKKYELKPYLIKGLLFDVSSSKNYRDARKWYMRCKNISTFKPNENLSVKVDSLIYYKYFFDIKTKKVKQLDIYMDSIPVNGKKINIEPLHIIRKGKLYYEPALMN